MRKPTHLIAALSLCITALGGVIVSPATASGRNGDIAFVSSRTGNWDIWLSHPDGSGLRNLTNHPAADGYPAWSPDGNQVAFATDRTGNWEIFAINADGTALRNLTNSPGINERYPAWSPDGRNIAFTEQNGDVWSAHVSVDGQIVVLDLAGGSRRLIAQGAFPSWSPDSSRITYAAPSNSGQGIFIVELVSGRAQEYAGTYSRALWPSWSPDGSQIAYWGPDDEIFVMNAADGTNRHNITNSALYDGAPSWSPDGARITFLRDLGSGEEDIFTMAADGTDVRQVTNDAAYDAWPAWQPLGSGTSSSSTTTTIPPSPTTTTRPTTSTTMPPTTTTTRPTATTTTSAPNVQSSSSPTQDQTQVETSSGYWMVTKTGRVFAFGAVEHHGEPRSELWYGLGEEAKDIAPTPSGRGYWIISNWTTYNYGDAPDLREFGMDLGADENLASISATPSGRGYWLFTNKGRVITRGDAGFFGDMGGVRLNGPILDSVATPSGRGYYMIGSDGGVFTFGDARFSGSTGKIKMNKPVVGIAPDPDGSGYWLVASDGGIFAFDASFMGSMGGTRINKPVSTMVGQSAGYLMVAEDGGMFAFGQVDFHGSLGANPPSSPVVTVGVIDRVRPTPPPPPPVPTTTTTTRPAPVNQTQQVASQSGNGDTSSSSFYLTTDTAAMTWACNGSGSYAGGCSFRVKNYDTGDWLESWMPDANTTGTTYLHPTTAGRYYVEVAEFNSGTTYWSFAISQQRCVQNCS